jgi:hypothetical protein
MPEGQSSRTLARFLVVKAKLQIAQHKYEEAVRTLQTGIALGRHVARGPTLVHGLIGVAITEVMLQALKDFVQAPGSPNLYFALAALPHPIVDFRSGIEMERDILYLSYPELQELKNREFTPEQLQPIIDRFTSDIASLGEESNYLPRNRFELAASTVEMYPEAKKRLVASGRPAAQVDAMPVFQVVMIDALEIYDEQRDQMIRWLYLPHWEAQSRITADEQLLKGERRVSNVMPLAPLLVPALQAISGASARADREVAMLRVIEAIRLYAASHDGQFPRRLADITEVPLPTDSFTNKNFEYTLTDGVATLVSPTGTDQYERFYRRQYEMRMAK